MTILRTSVVTLAGLALTGTAAAQQPTLIDSAGARPTITLEEAIQRAQRVQPTTVRAMSTVRNAEHQKRESVGAWFPTVSFSSSGSSTWNDGVTRIDPNTGLPNSSGSVSRNVSFGFNGSWDVFTGFRRGANIRGANAQIDAADAGLIDARYQVALQTKQQFYAALAATELVKVREASVRRAEEQLSVSVNKLRTGSATRSDSLRSLVNLGNARLQLVNAQADLATAEANLARLIGADSRVQAADDPRFHEVGLAVDEDALRQEALAASPAVVSSEASADAANASYSAAKAVWYPSLSLSGSWSWSGNNNVQNYDLQRQRQLRLNLSYPLFNGFTRERNIATQANALDVAEATAADTRRQVSANLTTQFAALRAALLQTEITGVSVIAAEEDRRVQQERYRLGASTIIDVLTSEEALTQAQVDEVNARFNVLRAKAQIEALIGRDL